MCLVNRALGVVVAQRGCQNSKTLTRRIVRLAFLQSCGARVMLMHQGDELENAPHLEEDVAELLSDFQ